MDALLKEVGLGNVDKFWNMINHCLHENNEVYSCTDESVVVATIPNRRHISIELLGVVMSQYGVSNESDHVDTARQSASCDAHFNFTIILDGE